MQLATVIQCPTHTSIDMTEGCTKCPRTPASRGLHSYGAGMQPASLYRHGPIHTKTQREHWDYTEEIDLSLRYQLFETEISDTTLHHRVTLHQLVLHHNEFASAPG